MCGCNIYHILSSCTVQPIIRWLELCTGNFPNWEELPLTINGCTELNNAQSFVSTE